jgi:hypothetical protein
MSDLKNVPPLPGNPKDPSSANGREGYESTLRGGRMRSVVSPESRDVGGWDAYRRWLNRVQSDDKRRSPVDPALYTWKGYRSWSEKIRRDWKPDEQ